jgi:uncharacterized protein (TIGR02301 family)
MTRVLAALMLISGFAADAAAQAVRTPAPSREAAQPAPPPEPPPPPYEAELLRLAEIMGALAFLTELCRTGPVEPWRAKALELIEAEGTSPARRERLAGAYNHGYRGYQLSYRMCTGNARLIIDRFLIEGGRIARDITSRYSG